MPVALPNHAATSPVNSEAVRCDEWVGDWEAALSHVERAVAATPLDALDASTWVKASMVMRYLETISCEVRGHSPTAKSSDAMGGRE
jgi:hypothetical protein